MLSAIASGLAVLGITWLADRLGGTFGGLLATAPITTTAAIVFLASSTPTAQLATAVLDGGRALFVALVAMPAYFYFLKHTQGRARTRVASGVLAFVALFTVGNLLLARLDWRPTTWLVSSALLALAYMPTFLRAHIPPRLLRGAPPPLRWPEALLRFAAGAFVILLVAWLRSIEPTLAAAWTVFPGTFLVTLAVLGFTRGAAASARAAQGGALGGLPFVAYLLVLSLVLPLRSGTGWALLSQLPAWAAYFVVLVPLWRARRAPTGSGE